MSRSPTLVEAKLLYAAPVKVPFDALLGDLNAAFAEKDVALAKRPESTDHSVVYASSDMHVRVECGDAGLDPEIFENALKAPVTQLNPADFRGPVYGHQAHVSISIGAGPFSMVQPAALYGGITPVEETRTGMDNRLMVARFLLDRIAAMSRPLAVYWPMSEKLMTADELRALRRDPYPLSLFVTPRLFSSGKMIHGVRVVGFQALGSEHLIGRRVVFREAPLPYDHLLRRTYEFVAYCRDRGEVIPDGDSFGISNSDVIRVHHGAPTEALPTGTVELTYERVGTEALNHAAAKRWSLARLADLRSSFEATPKKPITMTLMFCALTLAVQPILGAGLFVFNLLYGPKLRATVMVTILAFLITLSGVGVSSWLTDWEALLANLEGRSKFINILRAN